MQHLRYANEWTLIIQTYVRPTRLTFKTKTAVVFYKLSYSYFKFYNTNVSFLKITFIRNFNSLLYHLCL